MPVLPEIIDWSRERPLWQQDALRRLAEQPRLTAEDHAALVELCKSEFGISIEGVATAQPLCDATMGGSADGVLAVRLKRVHSVRHVNALRNDQTLDISPVGLTVVYGDNGTGKTGYVRVLKQVCRARGAKDAIHPNVYSEESPPASAVVCFESVLTGGVTGTADTDLPNVAPPPHPVPTEVTWAPGTAGPVDLAQVSVFDSRSAAVYVTDQNDVAYLPHGTDLFPKLVGVVEAVKSALESEMSVLTRDRFETIVPGSKVFDVLTSLHVDDARARVAELAALSDEDLKRLEELHAQDRRMKADDLLGRAQELRQCAARLDAARQRLAKLERALDESAISGLREAQEALATARAAADLASGGAFADAPIGGVGTETWRALWLAARRFAEDGAVPAQTFPPDAEAGATCVLCQQPVQSEAVARMRSFEEFVRGDTRAQVDQATRELAVRIEALQALAPQTLADEVLLAEIEGLDAELAIHLNDCRLQMLKCQEAALSHVQSADTGTDWSALAYTPGEAETRLQNLAECKVEEAVRFEAAIDPSEQRRVTEALRELEARVALTGLLDRVYEEIEREALRSKLRKCISSANTAPITKRNTELLKEVVSEPLAKEFKAQLGKLDLGHLPVAVAASHGQKGRAYHAVSLGKKTKAKIPTQDVLSEGEHRGVALAAFFAEVSLQDSASTVVFDDPVSSMDHSRRWYVAQRIAEIAKTRPVLVFTHDLVFLWMLQRASNAKSVALAPRYFRRDETGTGLISEDSPWDGQNVTTRVNTLKQMGQGLSKLAAGDRPKYERELRQFYGKLRDTWERAVEEILFNGAIRRFGQEVQTLRLKKLYLVTEKQMKDFEAGMTKASEWIQGHDHPAALALPVPEPAEALADLAALELWVKEIKKQYS